MSDRSERQCLVAKVADSSNSSQSLNTLFLFWKGIEANGVKNSFYPSKIVLLLLCWDFSTSFIYNWVLSPYYYALGAGTSHIYLPSIAAVIFLFSPVAGFLADVKFTRFKVIVCSTYVMLVSGIISTLILIIEVATENVGNTHIYRLAPLFLLLFVYSFGRMCFVANILQFALDQLQDEPTSKSVAFLYLYMFNTSLSTSVVIATNIPGHDFVLTTQQVSFDIWKTIVVGTLLVLSVLTMAASLLVTHKWKSQLVTSKLTGNPYKLVHDVLHFAWHNKKPVRHPSAFTYCEDERPSRLDFGKRKYGGPFTTEQIEDVKVMVRMLKVLLTLGPCFSMYLGVLTTILYQKFSKHVIHYGTNSAVKIIFLEYGLISPLLTMFFILIYWLVVQRFLLRWVPNLFKRMGLGIVVLCLSYILFLAVNTLAYDESESLNHLHSICRDQENNSTYVLNFNLFRLPSTVIIILQHILLAIHRFFLYVSSWEFISCQSPQHMKGLMFGLLYAIKAFFEFLAAMIFLSFYKKWKYSVVNCLSAFFFLNLGIGLTSLFLYTVTSKKYKYRKRDDICNYYQFAENYYSSSKCENSLVYDS